MSSDSGSSGAWRQWRLLQLAFCQCRYFAHVSSYDDIEINLVADSHLCKSVDIKGVTPHVLRHTFGSIAGELGFSELTIRAMLGHASQNVTQDYVHIDEAVKLAVERTSEEIAMLLDLGAKRAAVLKLAS